MHMRRRCRASDTEDMGRAESHCSQFYKCRSRPRFRLWLYMLAEYSVLHRVHIIIIVIKQAYVLPSHVHENTGC